MLVMQSEPRRRQDTWFSPFSSRVGKDASGTFVVHSRCGMSYHGLTSSATFFWSDAPVFEARQCSASLGRSGVVVVPVCGRWLLMAADKRLRPAAKASNTLTTTHRLLQARLVGLSKCAGLRADSDDGGMFSATMTAHLEGAFVG